VWTKLTQTEPQRGSNKDAGGHLPMQLRLVYRARNAPRLQHRVSSTEAPLAGQRFQRIGAAKLNWSSIPLGPNRLAGLA
jgi:hypothetical protein